MIHPHFLFNALNTVKSLYRKDPGAGDVYIVHLANFLRASVFSHSTKVSKLEDELALLCDYLEMQKIRFGTALECSLSTGDFAKKPDLAAAGGIGFQTKIGLGIGARYIYGLSKVSDFDFSGVKNDFKNNNIQASIFYVF